MNTEKQTREKRNIAVDLKPCPFCGRRVELQGNWDDYTERYIYVITCTNGGCRINPTGAGSKLESLKKRWNRRFNEGATPYKTL